MTDTFCKILNATFKSERCGLHWIQTSERDDEEVQWYPNWYLVDTKTDRILVMIEGPISTNICYTVRNEDIVRHYISLEGAKRSAVALAMQTVDSERINSARDRHKRRKSKQNSEKRGQINEVNIIKSVATITTLLIASWLGMIYVIYTVWQNAHWSVAVAISVLLVCQQGDITVYELEKYNKKLGAEMIKDQTTESTGPS
jgi:hypothetical protein